MQKVFRCDHKRRYSDEFAARAAAQHSIRTIGDVLILYVYHCTECRGWHLTKRVSDFRFAVTLAELIPFDSHQDALDQGAYHGTA